MKIIPKAKAFTKVQQDVFKKKSNLHPCRQDKNCEKKERNMIWIRFFFHNEKRKIYYTRTFIFFPTMIVKKSPWNNIKSNYDQVPK